jgi:hypothetical protein
MTLPALLALVVAWWAPAWGADLDAFSDLDVNDATALQEASRVLEEELKLAAKPRTYLVIDLVSATIQIKNRGIALHRLSVAAWTASSQDQMTGTFRLISRPSVVRRKVDPSATVEQEPISLADMPVHYHLALTPTMSLDIVPAVEDSPFLWVWWQGKKWWGKLTRWAGFLISGAASPAEPRLQLTLTREQAQSLAWSLVDGMPLVIRRPTDK